MKGSDRVTRMKGSDRSLNHGAVDNAYLA